MNGAQLPVTVVMLTYNRRTEALHSLERLRRLPERPCIVVVDNGSSDGTAEHIVRRFPEVELISAGANLGGAGRNLGVARAATPYVAFCDDDAWWADGSLALAAGLLDRHPRAAVLAARVVVEPDGREAPICRELAASPLPCDPVLPGVPLLGFLAGESVVRRDAFLQAGGFHERFFIGGEEELLALDLAAAGSSICYVPELVIHHQPSLQRSIASRNAAALRNRLWVAWLRRPVLRAIERTVTALSQASPDVATLQGLLAALAGLPWVLRERRVVPPAVERQLCLLEQRPEEKASPLAYAGRVW